MGFNSAFKGLSCINFGSTIQVVSLPELYEDAQSGKYKITYQCNATPFIDVR